MCALLYNEFVVPLIVIPIRAIVSATYAREFDATQIRSIQLVFAATGIFLTRMLLILQERYLPDAPQPSHPVQDMAASGDLAVIISMYVLGCVLALPHL